MSLKLYENYVHAEAVYAVSVNGNRVHQSSTFGVSGATLSEAINNAHLIAQTLESISSGRLVKIVTKIGHYIDDEELTNLTDNASRSSGFVQFTGSTRKRQSIRVPFPKDASLNDIQAALNPIAPHLTLASLKDDGLTIAYHPTPTYKGCDINYHY